MVKRSKTLVPVKVEYDTLLSRVSELLEAARQASARSVNTIITLTYWNIGWQIVEHEQSGDQRATYGKTLLAQLSTDLTAKYGRGFSRANLEYMRRFYRLWSIPQTLSGESMAHSKQINRIKIRLCSQRLFHFLGHTMCDSFQSKSRKHEVSMKKRQYELAGQ